MSSRFCIACTRQHHVRALDAGDYTTSGTTRRPPRASWLVSINCHHFRVASRGTVERAAALVADG